MKPRPDLSKPNLTIGDIYDYAVEVTDPMEARDFLHDLIDHFAKHYNQLPEEAAHTIRSNIGYYAGYYDEETRARAYRLYGAVHPIFGNTFPTAEEAFEAGKRMGENDHVG